MITFRGMLELSQIVCHCFYQRVVYGYKTLRVIQISSFCVDGQYIKRPF